MKKYSFIIGVGIMSVIILSYYAYYKSFEKAVNDRQDIVYNTKEPEYKNASVDNDEKVGTKCDMTIIDYQIKDGSKVKMIMNVDSKYIGLTRNELIECLNEESSNPTLEEINKGYIRSELIEFSKNAITIMKTYSEDDIPDKFYMKLRGNILTIYYADRKTVFENTDIDVYNLEATEIEELKKGISVDDEHTLFSILEGYSS